MISVNTISTVISKYGIVFSNFLLIVLSTKIWGSEGRGTIALIFTNIAIINIFTSICTGSTLAYHANKIEKGSLIQICLIWCMLISVLFSTLFSLIFSFDYFFNYLIIGLFSSLNSGIAIFFLGVKKINVYNNLLFVSALLPLLILGCFYMFFQVSSLNFYFNVIYLSLFTVLLIGIYFFSKEGIIRFKKIAINDFLQIASYGLKNELSYFLQFLSYRISYYVVGAFLGIKILGIYSITIALVESIWVISRSFSTVHFSEVLNSNDEAQNIMSTKKKAWQSFLLSLGMAIILLLIPTSIYELIFNKDFHEIKFWIIISIPGTLMLSFSNIYGHYFAAKNLQNVLIIKSLIAVLVTLSLIFFLVKEFELIGVYTTTNLSYIISSLYLLYCFYKYPKKLLIS